MQEHKQSQTTQKVVILTTKREKNKSETNTEKVRLRSIKNKLFLLIQASTGEGVHRWGLGHL